MLESRMSLPATVSLERVQALPIHSAKRANARDEFERAEATAETVLGIVARFRHAVRALRGMFAVRRQRLG